MTAVNDDPHKSQTMKRDLKTTSITIQLEQNTLIIKYNIKNYPKYNFFCNFKGHYVNVWYNSFIFLECIQLA